MICPNCGNVSEGKRSCEKCGAGWSPPLSPTAPAPGESESPIRISPISETGDLTGRTLDHKYYLESKLGAGVMGAVYRARRLQIGDRVAVKVLHPDQVTDPQSSERFRREAQTAASLKHPNIIPIYDFGVSREGLNYLVMELVEGENLRHLIDRHGKIPEAEAVEIIRQICAALDEAHKQDVVHRDIKPENILAQKLPGGLQVKVLDFGISALRNVTASRLTRTGAAMRRPHYMSPEHCLGEELDRRSDIYSLGIVLFEMLTGVVPFDSPIPTALVVKQVYEPPPQPRALNPSISPAIEAVVLRALEKWRDARPQTAGEMARGLIGAVNSAGLITVSEDVRLAPPPPPPPAPEEVRLAPPPPPPPAPEEVRLAPPPPPPPAPEEVRPAPPPPPPPAPKITPRPVSAVTPAPKTTPTPVKAVTPAPKPTPTPVKAVTPVSGRKVVPLNGASASGVSVKRGWNRKLVVPVLGALLLLMGGGFWWYQQKGGDEKAAATGNTASSGQQTSAVRGQPVVPNRNPTVAPTASPPASDKLWELISGQTRGVTDAANALGTANRQMAVIGAGGQLALEYREGRSFRDGEGSDLRVYGPEQQVTYLIFVRNDPAENWERIDINRKGFTQGEASHDMGHHGVRQARQVMIRNTGNADLRIDAISIVYKN
jgi:eukaryotic-like serine/threonine-protein kinase